MCGMEYISNNHILPMNVPGSYKTKAADLASIGIFQASKVLGILYFCSTVIILPLARMAELEIVMGHYVKLF